MTSYRVRTQKETEDGEIKKIFTFEADSLLEFFVKANFTCQKNNIQSTKDVVSIDICEKGDENEPT